MSRITSHVLVAVAAVTAGGAGATALAGSAEPSGTGVVVRRMPAGPEQVRTVVVTHTIHRTRYVHRHHAAPAAAAAPPPVAAAPAPAPAVAAAPAVRPRPAPSSAPLRTRTSGGGHAGGGEHEQEHEGGDDA